MEMGVRRAEAAEGLGTRSEDRGHQHPVRPRGEDAMVDLPPHPISGTRTTELLVPLSSTVLGP